MSNMLNQQPSGARVAFPSDNLRSIYGLCEKHPIFAELFGMRPQIRLVIDTKYCPRRAPFRHIEA